MGYADMFSRFSRLAFPLLKAREYQSLPDNNAKQKTLARREW
jgi:hypothetical protein